MLWWQIDYPQRSCIWEKQFPLVVNLTRRITKPCHKRVVLFNEFLISTWGWNWFQLGISAKRPIEITSKDLLLYWLTKWYPMQLGRNGTQRSILGLWIVLSSGVYFQLLESRLNKTYVNWLRKSSVQMCSRNTPLSNFASTIQDYEQEMCAHTVNIARIRNARKSTICPL